MAFPEPTCPPGAASCRTKAYGRSPPSFTIRAGSRRRTFKRSAPAMVGLLRQANDWPRAKVDFELPALVGENLTLVPVAVDLCGWKPTLRRVSFRAAYDLLPRD